MKSRGKSSRRREEEEEEDDRGDRKRSRVDGKTGKDYYCPRSDRRDGERDKERHMSSRGVEWDCEEDRNRGRHKEKERLREKEREGDRVWYRDRSQQSNYQSRRRRSEDQDTETEILRASRDNEGKESYRERERQWEESRRYKGKKVVEPEASPERDQTERYQRTVLIDNLPFAASDKDIFNHFSKAGKVKEARVNMDPKDSRLSEGCGHVEFYDAKSTEKALLLSNKMFMGLPITVKLYEAGKNSVQSTATGGGAGVLAEPNGAVPRKLFVGNLPFNVTENQLREVFEQFGSVELVQLPLDLKSGLCKGFGFVQFAQLEHANVAAQSLNGKEIAGQVIKVSALTDHIGVQDEFDYGGGLSLNAQQKLDQSGIATRPVGKPSDCLLLKNLYNLGMQRDKDFHCAIKETLEDACSPYASVEHIFIDKNTGHGWLKFNNVAKAVAAQRALHMRRFTDGYIEAIFVQPNQPRPMEVKKLFSCSNPTKPDPV